MPRRKRPANTERSEHWLRVAVNDHTETLDALMRTQFGWDADDRIEWLSPIRSDEYAEYFDEAFLDRLGVTKLKVPLKKFWPSSGPRWDGLARTESGKFIIVEAKAYVEEAVDYRSGATPASLRKINRALMRAKKKFAASEKASWETPFYQYANRLAHLYFLHVLNGLDAYLLFINFADAPDVPAPCSVEQWLGANRLLNKCMGLTKHPYVARVKTLNWSVPQMLAT